MKKINVALVGLSFGGSFAPIYKNHPYVNTIGIFDLNKELMEKTAELNGIQKTYSSF